MYKIAELTNPDSCLNRARDDEMVFVLLARDPAAPAAIREWCTKRWMLKKNESTDPQILEALEVANTMQNFSSCMNKGAIETMKHTNLIANLIKQRDLLALAMKEMIDGNNGNAGRIVDIVKAMGVKPEVPMASECRKMYGIDV